MELEWRGATAAECGVAAIEDETLRRFLEATVAATFKLPIGEIRQPTRRQAAVAFGRQVAMYIAHVGLGLSLTETGRLFGRDRTTAAHACRVIEDRRDDPGVDRVLVAIEGTVESWRGLIGRSGRTQ